MSLLSNLYSMKKILIATLVLSFTLAIAEAHSGPEAHAETISAFRSYFTVAPQGLKVPTVVSVPLPEMYMERQSLLIEDETSDTFIPSLYMRTLLTQPDQITVVHQDTPLPQLSDASTLTTVDFDVTGDSAKEDMLILTSKEPMSVSGVTVLLDQFVALPQTISILAGEPNDERVVLTERNVTSQTIRFPKTFGNRFVISFVHVQPLRISDIQFIHESVTKDVHDSVRFLAQPGHTYSVYFDPDRVAGVNVGEAPNLSDNTGVRTLEEPDIQKNKTYVQADSDSDGVPDVRDNCVQIHNTTQVDIDENGRGDTCDDFDKDGVSNGKDNCVNDPNGSQVDTDADGIGDICDGEESRITESHPYLPWMALGIVALLLAAMLYSVITRKPPQVA